MPVDIATGDVDLAFADISIPGKVDLVWERIYNTTFLDREHSPLGHGWTTRYLATLSRKAGGFEFVTPYGTPEFIPDPGGLVERSQARAVNLGAFLEIFRAGQRYVVQKWDVETGSVWRYCFIGELAASPSRLASIEDATGQAVDLLWTETGILTSIRQRLEQRTLLLTHNSQGLVEKVTLRGPEGETYPIARYEYSAGDRLLAAYDSNDNAERYEYDRAGRITRQIAKDGGVFNYRYDHKGRCILSSGIDRYDEKRLRFLDAVSVTEVTNSYGHTFRYQRLPSGQILREINPLGGQRKTDYDEHGRIIAKTDATGAVTRYSYDHEGNRHTVTDALGNMNIFEYTEHHLLVGKTNPLGQVWRRTYDESNRLIGILDPLGGHWQFRYDAEGNVDEIENPLGARKVRHFTRGVLGATTDWVGHLTRFRWDAFGRMVERQGPEDAISRFRYDRLGNPVGAILPDGAGLEASYDSAGNLVSFADANGHTTRFRFGPCRRLLERIDAAGGVVRYIWGSEPGQLEQVINEKGERYRFFRDEVGRIVKVQGFDGSERSYQYDGEGYIVSHTKANGETIGLHRDALHRVTEQTLPGGGKITCGFDPIGNLIGAANADIAVSFEHDPLGRVVREVQGERWVESQYDALGNLVHTTTSEGHAVDYAFDANGAVATVTTRGSRILELKRDASGDETSRRMAGDVVMEQRYEVLGRPISQLVARDLWAGEQSTSPKPGRREIVRRSYAYDRNGLLTSSTDSRWGRVDYTYDSAHRLTETRRGVGPSESFSYDSVGNVTELRAHGKESGVSVLVHGPGSRLLRKGGTEYKYDLDGRRCEMIEDADSHDPKVWSYDWDALDRLRSVTRPDGQVWRYKYDAFGRRVEKAGPTGRRQYLWDKEVVIHELEEERSKATWIFDRRSFAPLATLQSGALYCTISDHLGTPREMIDSSGSVVWSTVLESWGTEIEGGRNNGRIVKCPIRFQGQWHDEETGLHYNRFRYYDPESARYISHDPIGFLGGKLNTYAYALEPNTRLDPLGLMDPNDIQFTQPTISDTFSDPASPWAGKTLGEAIAATKAAGQLPPGLELHVMELNGGRDLVTLNNRTLYVAQKAGVPVSPVMVGPEGQNKLNKLLDGRAPLEPGEEPEVVCKK